MPGTPVGDDTQRNIVYHQRVYSRGKTEKWWNIFNMMELRAAARAGSHNSLGKAWKGVWNIFGSKGRKLLHHAGLQHKVLSLKVGNLPKCRNTDICLLLPPELESHQLRGIITGQLPAVFMADILWTMETFKNDFGLRSGISPSCGAVYVSTLPW